MSSMVALAAPQARPVLGDDLGGQLAFGRQAAACPAAVAARGRGNVAVVATGGDGHVPPVGPPAVARVEGDGASAGTVRYEDLGPGMGAALADEVAGDVAGTDADRAAHREHDVRLVL